MTISFQCGDGYRPPPYDDRIDLQDIGVTVLEHGSRILPPMPEALSAFGERKMTTQGTRIRKGVAVEAISRDGVHLVGGEFVQAGYWAMTPTFGRKMQIAFDWVMSAFLPPGSHRDIAEKNEAARKR